MGHLVYVILVFVKKGRLFLVNSELLFFIELIIMTRKIYFYFNQLKSLIVFTKLHKRKAIGANISSFLICISALNSSDFLRLHRQCALNRNNRLSTGLLELIEGERKKYWKNSFGEVRRMA